ncbi:hypothetical protein [Isoptericola sp. BMS4]|uniref:hypothetical protein n=1 Tax=Isoptericola sp. BMS4 TaxID=2527875 RepID=UPI001421C850|nr:hypothetical protein [Isoptericola sp. BMS4]
MTTVNWLTQGHRSDAIIITAPATPDETAATAANDLDGLLLRPTAEELPGWFRRVQKLGYWWYLVCVVVTVPVFAALGSAPTGTRLAIGAGAGVTLALLSGAAMNSIAHAQARREASAGARARRDSLRDVARVAPPRAQETVPAILEAHPETEAELHRLVWRAAQHQTPDGRDALDHLERLLADAAPGVAAHRTADDEELERKLADLRKRNGL